MKKFFLLFSALILAAACSAPPTNREAEWPGISPKEAGVKPPMPPPPSAKATAKAGATPAAPPAMPVAGPDPEANEKMVWDLFKAKNYDGFASLLAPDFLEVEPDAVYD